VTLKQAREALGWSQAKLDSKAGVPRSTVSDIERGKNANPSIDSAFRLTSALRKGGLKGITVEQLFGAQSEVSR
jgi:DNA-binding XRE family transcriptional regulator